MNYKKDLLQYIDDMIKEYRSMQNTIKNEPEFTPPRDSVIKILNSTIDFMDTIKTSIVHHLKEIK